MQIGLGTSITGTRGGVGISVSIGSGFAITGGTLTATVSGLVGGETVTFQWTDDGGNISGATSSTYAATIGTDSVADASRMRCVATVDGTPYTSNSRILAYAAGTAPAIADGRAFVVGTAVNIDASASGANLTFAYTLTGAPAGVTINASTGAITGDPTTVETGTVTITATDQYGRALSDTFTFGVTAAPVAEAWVVTGHSIGDAWTIKAGFGNDGPEDLAIEDGVTLTWTSSTGPTAPALNRYNGRTTLNGVNLQAALDAGADYLVGIEGMNETTGLDTYINDFGSPPALAYEGALAWHEAAQTAGLSEHFYVRWAGYNTAYGGVFGQAWRDRITDVASAQWDGIKTYVDANKSGALPFTWVYLDAAFAVLFDRIQAGTYTEFAIGDFFGDEVHPSTDLGQWLSCVFVWHSIRGSDPAAYPLTLGGMAGSITSAQRAEIVDLIVDVAADPSLAFALTVPVITGTPTISGTETEGQTLTATAASVAGNPTPTRTWQWERSGTPISGATSATYTLVSADAGQTLTVVQTETNSEGADTAESSATGTIVALAAPVITGVPTISGTETEDETLTATAASVTGNPTPTRTWQWERTGVAISGATSATYTLVTADVGETITVVQTETNSEGSDTAESTATGTIAAAAAAGPLVIESITAANSAAAAGGIYTMSTPTADADDVLLFVMNGSRYDSSDNDPAETLSGADAADWTEVTGASYNDPSFANIGLRVFWAVAGDVTEFAITGPNGTYRAGVFYRFSGANTTTPIAASAILTQASEAWDNTRDIQAPSVTVPEGGAVVHGWAQLQRTNGTMAYGSTPAGYTLDATPLNDGIADFILVSQDGMTAGASGTQTIGITNGAFESRLTLSVAINPA